MPNKTTNENILNRVARVFVSSTFRDMKPERDYLMTTIFPRIRQHCQAKDVEFVPLDLRWGIPAEEAETGHVTEVCLKEIEKSRPFFIGMLGERYGWQPGKEELKRNPNLTFDFPFVRNDFGKQNLSITEVEMKFGVLRWQGEPLDAAFWLRSREMPTPEEFCEKPGSDAAAKLQQLKEEIRRQTTYPVAEYTSPEDLGEQIYNELIKWIDKKFPDTGVTWLQKQNIEQSSFERSRKWQYVPRPSDYAASWWNRFFFYFWYVPRPSDYAALDAFLASDTQTLTVTGVSGTGKSALLANWMDDYRKRFKNVYLLSHYISASSGSDSPAEILRRLTETLDPESIEQESTEQESTEQESTEQESAENRLKDLSKKAKTLEDCTREFAQAVEVYCSRHPNQQLVIVLDGMNQLNAAGDAKNLTWFPRLPDCVKVLFSTIDSDQTMRTFERFHYEQFTVEPLSEEQRNKIIDKFLSCRGRRLTREQTARIAAKPESSIPLVLRTLLDELCVFGEHERLDERIDWYLSANDPEEFFHRVLERLENDYGLDETRILLTSLAVSRFGLSETELIQLTNFTPRTVSTLLCSLDSHIVNRSGLYDFTHDIIRSAVLSRYASHLTKARERLIEYFLSDTNESFSRQCHEVPWQYQSLQRWDDLYQFLLHFPVMRELYKWTLNCDFCLYWSELLKLIFSPEAYFELDVSGESKPDQAKNWFKLAHFTYLFHCFDLTERGYTEALAIYRELATQNPEAYRPMVADTLNSLGILHWNNGRHDLAEEVYKEALSIRRKLAAENPEVYRPKVADTLNNLGILHDDNRHPDLAEKEYKEALEIYRELTPHNPEKYQHDLSNTLNNLGALHQTNGLPDLAEEEYNEALEIFHELAAQNPEKYRPDVADTLNNQGVLHYVNGRPDLAEEEYKEAIVIYRTLADRFPEAYRHNVALTLNNLGVLHQNNERSDLAEKEYKEALAIRRELAAKFPEAYQSDLATTLYNLGILHKGNRFFYLAEKELYEALAIRRELAAKFPEAYQSDLATTLYNLGILHKDNGRPDLAEKEYNEAIVIYRALADKFPETYQSDLATTLYNLGILHKDNGRPDLAKKEYKEALAIHRELAVTFPETYQFVLTTMLYNLGILHKDNGRFSQEQIKYFAEPVMHSKQAAPEQEEYHPNVALTSLEKALGICQKLAGKKTNAYHSDCQMCLRLRENIRNM